MKKIYISLGIIIIVGLAIFGFIKLNKKYGFLQSEEVAERIYQQGMEDVKKGDLQNAYYNFSKVSRYSKLYEATLFRQGLIATELKDDESAIKAYETLLERFPNTFFAQKAIYNLSVAYFNKNDKEKAYANFRLITKKYEDSDYADASNYFLGVLIKDNEKNKDKAIEHFFEYIKIAPRGKYSLSSIKELLTLKQSFSNEENLYIGISLSENEKYNDALKYLNLAKIDDAWAYIAIAYKKSGNIPAFKKMFEEGISKYSKNGSNIQEKAVNEYVSLYGKVNGLKAVKTLCDKSKCQLNDYILYNSLPTVDKNTKITYYNMIYTDFPKGDYAADALFNSMYNDYKSGSYDNAIIKGKKHISLYSDKKSAPATMYWLARTYNKKNNLQEEKSYYNKILLKYNDSYYAYLSFKRLAESNDLYNIVDFTPVTEENTNVDFPVLHSNISINESKKIDALIRVKDFKIFEYADFDNDIIKSWVGYYEGDLAKASVVAENIVNETQIKPSYSDDIYKLVYPIGFAKEINTYSNKDTKVAPYLMLSLIKQESHFNTSNKSVTGASGLTQLMPDTAQYIAGLKNIKYNKNKLSEADYNIMLGTTYYSYIKSKYFNYDMYALAAYNSGYGTVSGWLKNSQAKDLDEFVEEIPYTETKDYIKQIYKNYWAYSCLYNPGKLK